jgi:rRNA-processing protein FCF1
MNNMILEEELFARYAGKGVLLDSNLLLVLLSGALGIDRFKRFKRVSNYTIQDYELLVRLIQSFTILVTTPHILTEVSNLANSLPEPYKHDWYSNLAAFVRSEGEPTGVMERWTPARQLAATAEFAGFGITDSALTELAPEVLVITADYRLSGTLRSRGVSVLNFVDLRKLRLLADD